MALKFGTSGIRGLNSDFTEAAVHAWIQAFVDCAKTRFHFESVAVAGDLRESTPGILHLVRQTLGSNQLQTADCGFIPTPALAYFCSNRRLPGIMVTGSHIPGDRNGIKFYWPEGEILKGDEEEILRRYKQLLPQETAPTLTEAGASYVQRYVQAFADYKKYFAGKTVLLFEHSSVARDLMKAIFSQLGFQVLAVGRSPLFIPVDTETPEATRLIKKEITALDFQGALFAVISTDGDADRPLLCDENFSIVPGDILGFLAACFLKAQTVVTPISSNTGLEISGQFSHILRTKIGSPYVIEGMAKENPAPIVGYEANGGFLLGSEVRIASQCLSALPTRDAVLPVLAVLALAAEQNKSLSELVHALPPRFTAADVRRGIEPAVSQQVLEQLRNPIKIEEEFSAIESSNELDGLRLVFKNAEIVHFRPSGNAPEFRCYAEATSAARAQDLVQLGLQLVDQIWGNVKKS